MKVSLCGEQALAMHKPPDQPGVTVVLPKHLQLWKKTIMKTKHTWPVDITAKLKSTAPMLDTARASVSAPTLGFTVLGFG